MKFGDACDPQILSNFGGGFRSRDRYTNCFSVLLTLQDGAFGFGGTNTLYFKF